VQTFLCPSLMLSHIDGNALALNWSKAVEQWTVRLLVKHLVRDCESVLVVSLDGEVDESDIRPLFQGIEKAKVQIVNWRRDGPPYVADTFDVGSFSAVCTFSNLQQIFESIPRVDAFLDFASSALRVGGYLFGTTTDSSALWTLAQKEIEIRGNQKRRRHSGVFKDDIRVGKGLFEMYLPSGENFKNFGTECVIRYKNDGAAFLVEKTEYLVHFPTLVEMAKESDLQMLQIDNFREFYEDHRKVSQDLLNSVLSDFQVEAPTAHAYEVISLLTTFTFLKNQP